MPTGYVRQQDAILAIVASLPLNQQNGRRPMRKPRRFLRRAYSWSRLVLAILPVLLLLSLTLSAEMTAVAAAEKQNSGRQSSISAPCVVKPAIMALGKSQNTAYYLYNPALRKPIRTSAFQGGGGGCPLPSDYKCVGSCPQQCLGCAGGAQVTVIDGCCAKCCNSSGCSDPDCCRSQAN